MPVEFCGALDYDSPMQLQSSPSTFPPITDPQEAPRYDGALSRALSSLLHEARDEVFLRHTLRMYLVMAPAMAALWLLLHLPSPPAWLPAWLPALAYLGIWGMNVPPVILMLHNTMHRRFFKSARLNKWHPYTMTFFFGIPSGYREHHMGIHHMEDNMEEDISSTIHYRRDSFLHFLAYFGRFFVLTPIELPAYLIRKGRAPLGRRVIAMELAHEAIIVAVMILDWRFGLPAFLIPFVTCRFMMMAGNWGQHAFINTARKNDGVANAVTCINAAYNRRCFNDGYHIGHHLKASRHWTELPADFIANRERYAREGAIVFEGIDFFWISLLLWTGQWRALARHYVRLDGPRSDEEVIEMLKGRVQQVKSWPLEAIGVAAA